MMLTMPWWVWLLILAVSSATTSGMWLWYHLRVVRWWANYAQEADDLAHGWRELCEDALRGREKGVMGDQH